MQTLWDETFGGNVPLFSMTGYARAEAGDGSSQWVWEARSVNGRGLELRSKLPPGLERIEVRLRQAAAACFKRGNISLALTLDHHTASPAVRINHDLLDRVLAVAREVQGHQGVAPATADGLLRIKGIIEVEDRAEETQEQIAARDEAILKTLDQALAGLAEARATEGAKLAAMLSAHIERIDALTGQARETAATQPAAIRERIKRQIDELAAGTVAVSEERMAQEIALAIQKADVREELDRLGAHLTQARELMAASGPETPVGRKFDFLCQEFNREANTLCSKAAEIDLTRIGIDLKSAIEQLREQVQNVE